MIKHRATKAGLTIVLLLMITAPFPLLKRSEAEITGRVPTDLSNHPLYKAYNFGQPDRVIAIGVQPLYFPTGLISETMKRDRILAKALQQSGLEIRFFSFLKGDDVNHFLRQGDLKGGIGGDMPAVTAAATLDIVVPSLIQQGFTSVVAKDHMLMSELRGKRIGYAYGSNAHYALLKALASDGVAENQVRLISMETVDMAEALHTGSIDAFSAWEPTPTLTLAKYPEFVVIHRSLSTGYLYFQKEFSQRHPKAARAIVAAEIRAIRWIQSRRENLLSAAEWSIQAGETLVGRSIGLSVKQNAEMAGEDLLSVSSAPLVPKHVLQRGGSLQREFEFLKRLGKVPSSVLWERVHRSFDRRIITEVLADPVHYAIDEFDYERD